LGIGHLSLVILPLGLLWDLVIGHWSLFGVWILVFGVF
jgi:hypothetical protein